MKRLPNWNLHHPDQRRLLLLLACIAAAVILLAVLERFRCRAIDQHRELLVAEQAHLDLVQTLRLDLRAARLALHRLSQAREAGTLSAREAEADAAFKRIRELLVLMHQGGEWRGEDGTGKVFVLAPPLPSDLLAEASKLVPLARDIADHGALLARDLIRRLSEPGAQGDDQVEDRAEPLFVQAEALAGAMAVKISERIEAQIHAHRSRTTRFLSLGVVLGGILVLGTVWLCLRSLGAVGRMLREREKEAWAVAEANAGMERVLEALPVGVAILGQDRVIRRVNLAATNLLDIEPGWLFERHVSWDMFCEQDRRVDSEHPLRARFEHEVRMRALEGRVLEVITSSIPVILQGETLILEVFMDVTLRKQAERELLEEKSRLESLLAGIDGGVALTDEDGAILEVNESLCRILGLGRSDLLAAEIGGLFPGGILRVELNDGLRSLRTAPRSRLREIHVDSFRDMALVVRMRPVLRSQAFAGMIVSVVEVTEIVEARRRAEAASRAKSMFLANMSHEIRTPMNAILGHGELLARTPMTDEQAKGVQSIRVCAESLLRIINDILDFSKIEAGMLRIEPGEVNLAELLERVRTMFAELAWKRGLELRLKTSELPPVVRTDAGRLSQVLVNLVGNAVKFTDQGFVELAVQAEPAQGSSRVIAFTVRDTGIGIPADRQEGIFASFEQADGSLTRQYGGTGLGLTIADNLVRLLGGGGISVQSWSGRGSVFSFSLVVEVPSPAVLATDSAAPASDAGPGYEHVRILAAEDNPFNRGLLVKMLKSLQVGEITMAENGREAVEALAGGKTFDLVLMDIQMPVLDGLEATRQIRAMGLAVPVIALTAHALESDQRNCLAAGMDGHLAKPYRLHELTETLEAWCPRISH